MKTIASKFGGGISFSFQCEASESSCLKFVKNTIIEAYWISGKPFFMEKSIKMTQVKFPS